MSYKHSIRGGGLMRVTITSESGDWKANLYTKDIAVYEVKNQEILDFFIQLGDAYANNDTVDDMFECLYNLINYGYLYTDEDTDDNYYDDFDYEEVYKYADKALYISKAKGKNQVNTKFKQL
jgi:phage gp29-like protein